MPGTPEQSSTQHSVVLVSTPAAGRAAWFGLSNQPAPHSKLVQNTRSQHSLVLGDTNNGGKESLSALS